MKTECLQYFKNPYYWAVIGLGLAARAVLACLDFRYRGQQFWGLAADFWNKTGSIAMGFLILLVMIRRFSYDTELRTFPIINSTSYGRLCSVLEPPDWWWSNGHCGWIVFICRKYWNLIFVGK